MATAKKTASKTTNSGGVVQRTLSTISERISGNANVRQVFGDPIETQGRTVIPVAKIRFGFGGGMGAKHPDDPATNEEGAGGGGALLAHPVGVLDVTPERTTFVPTADYVKLALGIGAGLLLGLWLGGRARR